MTMRKAAVITGFFLLMLAIFPVQQADAIQAGDTVSLTWAPWNTGSSGGEFTVSDYTTKAALFTTFCVEPNEYFYLGEKLTVQSVGTTIMYNGGSTPIALRNSSRHKRSRPPTQCMKARYLCALASSLRASRPSVNAFCIWLAERS